MKRRTLIFGSITVGLVGLLGNAACSDDGSPDKLGSKSIEDIVRNEEAWSEVHEVQDVAAAYITKPKPSYINSEILDEVLESADISLTDENYNSVIHFMNQAYEAKHKPFMQTTQKTDRARFLKPKTVAGLVEEFGYEGVVSSIPEENNFVRYRDPNFYTRGPFKEYIVQKGDNITAILENLSYDKGPILNLWEMAYADTIKKNLMLGLFTNPHDIKEGDSILIPIKGGYIPVVR